LNQRYRRLWIGLAAVALAAGLATGCGGNRDLTEMSARQLFNYGMEHYQNRKYLKSVNAFQTIVFNFPGTDFIDTAQYYLALSYYAEEEYALASVEFNRLLVNYPASPFASHSQLMKAVCFFEGTPENYGLDQTDLETAIRQFEDFQVDYPESEAVPEAKAYLSKARSRLAKKYYESGVVYTRMGDMRAARVYFQKVVDDYTGTEYAAQATYQLAECYFNEKNYPEAIDGFTNFRIVFPQHEWVTKAAERACESAFKGGRRAFEAGELEKARELFQRVENACGSDSDRSEEARTYLSRIADTPVVDTGADNAGS